MEAEVFSNLVHVTPELWDLFDDTGRPPRNQLVHQRPRQSTSRSPAATPTGRPSPTSKKPSHENIPLRAGVIDGILPGQHTEEGSGTAPGARRHRHRRRPPARIRARHQPRPHPGMRQLRPPPRRHPPRRHRHPLPPHPLDERRQRHQHPAGRYPRHRDRRSPPPSPPERAVCPPDGGLCEPDKQCPPDNLCNPTGQRNPCRPVSRGHRRAREPRLHARSLLQPDAACPARASRSSDAASRSQRGLGIPPGRAPGGDRGARRHGNGSLPRRRGDVHQRPPDPGH